MVVVSLLLLMMGFFGILLTKCCKTNQITGMNYLLMIFYIFYTGISKFKNNSSFTRFLIVWGYIQNKTKNESQLSNTFYKVSVVKPCVNTTNIHST